MRILLLPGNSAGNRESIEQAQKAIGGEILYYQHWDSNTPTIDFEVEAKRLVHLAGGDRVYILAKSAGTLLAMKTVREARLQIEKAVFLGTAVNWGAERGMSVQEWLREWGVPTLFVHKEHDPVISAAELSMILNGRHELLVLPGNDHDYNQIDQFILKTREMFL